MISSIRLQRFRSYRDESFEFDAGVNIIVGPNASGKTNLLEALLVAARGSSFRAKDAELVAHGAPWSRLDVLVNDHQRVVKLLPQSGGSTKKSFTIDDKPFTRLTTQRTVPFVLFEPNHLQLLHGAPELRREFLDNLLSQTVPGYEVLRRDYKRALSQRNALLKRGKPTKAHLFAWDVRLSEIGAHVAQGRYELVTRMNETTSALYNDLSHTKKTDISLHYMPSASIQQYSSNMLKLLEARHAVDVERGFTTIGPHREDFRVDFNGRSASEVASRGEIRSLLLVLKVIELQEIESFREQKPILLLDDVFSELDGARRKALTQIMGGHQAFITTTDADVVVQHFMDKCKIIPLG